MNLSQNKNAVDWTEFVAACVDLSDPKMEPCILTIFQGADKAWRVAKRSWRLA